MICQWGAGKDCEGKVEEKLLFDSQIICSICEKHFKQFKYIRILNASGLDMDEILRMPPEQKEKEALLLSEQDEKLMNKIGI